MRFGSRQSARKPKQKKETKKQNGKNDLTADPTTFLDFSVLCLEEEEEKNWTQFKDKAMMLTGLFLWLLVCFVYAFIQLHCGCLMKFPIECSVFGFWSMIHKLLFHYWFHLGEGISEVGFSLFFRVSPRKSSSASAQSFKHEENANSWYVNLLTALPSRLLDEW